MEAVLIICKPCSLTVHSALCCSSFRIDVFVLTCGGEGVNKHTCEAPTFGTMAEHLKFSF